MRNGRLCQSQRQWRQRDVDDDGQRAILCAAAQRDGDDNDYVIQSHDLHTAMHIRANGPFHNVPKRAATTSCG